MAGSIHALRVSSIAEWTIRTITIRCQSGGIVPVGSYVRMQCKDCEMHVLRAYRVRSLRYKAEVEALLT